jgi:periplasmic protein TonB
MKTTKLATATIENDQTLDDIIFKNKNHEYGAFELRRTYIKTVNRAFYLGTFLFIFGLAIPTIFAKFSLNNKEIWRPITLTSVNQPVVNPPIELPPPPPPVERQKASTTKFNQIVILPDVPDVEPIPTQKEFEKAPPGEITNIIPGGEVPIIDERPEPSEPVEIKVTEEGEIVFVDTQAEFEGGYAALAKFLRKNLNYPRMAIDAGVTGKVFVSFVVDKFGEISDIQITKGIGFNCDEEAIRVIKAMPKWNPGRQGGRAVKSRFNLPIVFMLE